MGANERTKVPLIPTLLASSKKIPFFPLSLIQNTRNTLTDLSQCRNDGYEDISN